VGDAYTRSGAYHAFIYSGGTMTDLGTLGGTNSRGYGINSNGQVVGRSDTRTGDAYHAYLYSGGTMSDLDTRPGTNYSVAIEINDSGQIAGYALFGFKHAVLFSSG